MAFRYRLAVSTILAAATCLASTFTAVAGSPQESARIADERLEASYNSSAEFIRDSALDAYLLLVVQRLKQANHELDALDIRIHALREALPYSFALDNGALYVSSGLLARLNDEDQLAAMIALPLAPIIRHDRQNMQAASRRHLISSYLPNVLILAATAGVGALAINKADEKRETKELASLQATSDTAAIHWLANAGYDPKSAAAALRRLQELLAAEQRSGIREFNDPALLASRADSLAVLGAATPPAASPGQFASHADSLRKISVYFSLMMARDDIDAHPASVEPILDRVESLQGQNGISTFLRAEIIRRNSLDKNGMIVAIQAYERCIGFADAPPIAYRELGHLYRRLGNDASARRNFIAYLSHAPNAADAPIIRTYVENP